MSIGGFGRAGVICAETTKKKKKEKKNGGRRILVPLDAYFILVAPSTA